MAHDVFISYSANDKVTADAVCATLEANGIRCWIAPRDILPGMEYAEALVDAIRSSRLLVLVFSSGANDSVQVRQEVERAVSLGLPVLPFRIENIPPSHAMELFISGRHWLDALTPPLESHLLELAKTTKLLLLRPVDEPKLHGVVAVPAPLAAEPPARTTIGSGRPELEVQATARPPVTLPAATSLSPALPKWLVMTKDQALKHIRNAWVAGLFSALITVIAMLASMSGDSITPGLEVNVTAMVDVAIVLGLCIGVFRKSRLCAVGLLAFFVLSKIIMSAQGAEMNVFGALIAVLLVYLFYQGVRSTWAYGLMKGVWGAGSPPAPPAHDY
jgi:hypothetical protein